MKTMLLLAILAALVCPSKIATFDRLRSCPGHTPQASCAEFWRYDTVFIGTVKTLVNEHFPEGPRPGYQQYRKVTATLAVDETFRGNLGPEVVFDMEDCYFEFKQDEVYLIYTNKGQGGKFELRRSSGRTRLLSDASEDLAFIRSLPDAPSGGRIEGVVYDHRGSVTLRVDDVSQYSNPVMPGVIVYLRDGEKNFQTSSDATGHYEFTRVPEGTYELSTDLPDFLSGSRHTLKLVDKSCVNARLSIQATGSIKGRLVGPDGARVEKAVVSIFTANGVTEDMFERVRTYYMTRDETGKDGSFKFVRLRAGRYHLAINMVEAERIKDSGASNYPRMFHPGVNSFIDAKPITLGDGAKIEDVVITLPNLNQLIRPADHIKKPN